jgi:cytochrome c biogenesis protein CcmG, thiol:disulfide interchange protein DsbE
LRQSSGWSSTAGRRVFDWLALAVIAYALWKFVVAPRNLDPGNARPAPHAVFTKLEGGAFRVADERGRLVFLDFYASWCEPCKIELPLVERWAAAHPRTVVVPVDVAEPRSLASTFARLYDLHGVALDPNAASRALFSVRGLPTVIVIDPSGNVRAKWEGLNPAIALAMTNAEQTLTR